MAELKELQASAEKHVFAAEVDRMMKLIINSLYRNKEVSHKSSVQFKCYVNLTLNLMLKSGC